MKSVLVVGANRGIGLEFCRQYQQEGWSVIAACRKASTELQALDVKIVENIDVTDMKSLKDLAKELKGQKLDILVHNAGILFEENWPDIDFSTVKRQLEVNAMGPLQAIVALQASLDHGSKIGLVTSRMGSIGDNESGGYYGYRMSKAALNAAGKNLALDLRPRGIAVALLHPGFVKTDMTAYQGMIDPPESVNGMRKCLENLRLETSGSFWHYNGEELPW